MAVFHFLFTYFRQVKFIGYCYFILCCWLLPLTIKAQPQKLPLRILQGYHANERLPLEKGVNYLVFSKESDFERYFGKSFERSKPNFDFEHVIVMITAPTREQYFFSFEPEAYKAGNFIEIYCNSSKARHLLTYTDHPIAIAAIPKYYVVNSIRFYTNQKRKKLLKTVVVKAN